MELVTAAEMRTADHRAIKDIGIPGIILMEHAGTHIAKVVHRYTQSDHIVCFAGRGNNGGDGFVAARALHNQGYDVTIISLAKPEDMTPDTLCNYKAAASLNIDIIPVTDPRIPDLLSCSGAIIDALLGTGVKGSVTGPARQAIELINKASCPVISVDLPSGVNADTSTAEIAVNATVTVTLGAVKRGLILPTGQLFTGKIILADIGIPPSCIQSSAKLIDIQIAKKLTPQIPVTAHKGTCGRVLVIAGSRGYTGASILTASSVLKAGAGLCYLAAPQSVCQCLESNLIEVITIPLPDDHGIVTADALSLVIDQAKQMDAIAIGPGLGRTSDTAQLITDLIQHIDLPVIIDADGLYPFEGKLEKLHRSAPTIITPHIGEMARLLGVSTSQIQTDLIGAARAATDQSNAICVLKSSTTIIATDDHTYCHLGSNPGLATAGSGDVLTGIISGLTAQTDPAHAAIAGVYLHSSAGRLARTDIGVRGMVASDVCNRIPAAWQELERCQNNIHTIEGAMLLDGSETIR